MTKLLYWILLKPISLLPLGLLYGISDLLFLVVFYVVPYRKKVVEQNIQRVFPNKSKAQRQKLTRRFYRHLCDLIVETLKLFSISKEELLRRCPVKNPELVRSYFDQNQSIIIPAGHYGNWELAAVAFDLQIPHQSVVLYAPLKNVFFDKKIQVSRSRFGLQLLPWRQTKKWFQQKPSYPAAVVFAADQSPRLARSAYWMTFLGQETGVMIGAEKYARQSGFPVVFGKMTKVKRGYYEIEFIELENQPKHTSFGQITEKHTRQLEKIILEEPAWWLWTHRRWKRQKPKSI